MPSRVPARVSAARYHRLAIDVGVVVVINKVMPKRLAKNQPRNRKQIKTNKDSLGESGICRAVLVHQKFSGLLSSLSGGKHSYQTGERLLRLLASSIENFRHSAAGRNESMHDWPSPQSSPSGRGRSTRVAGLGEFALTKDRLPRSQSRHRHNR